MKTKVTVYISSTQVSEEQELDMEEAVGEVEYLMCSGSGTGGVLADYGEDPDISSDDSYVYFTFDNRDQAERSIGELEALAEDHELLSQFHVEATIDEEDE